MTLLSIDIDGVLHARDAHFAVGDTKTASMEGLRAAGLFQHCRALADLLATLHEVELVMHSSWRLAHGIQELREFLGPAGRYLKAVTPPELEREASVLEFMRRRRLRAADVVLLDDQPALFSELRGRVIVCDPVSGLSSPGVLAAVRDAFSKPTARRLAEKVRDT